MISRFRRHFSKDRAAEKTVNDVTPDTHAALRHAIREIDNAVDDLSKSYATAAGRRIEAERHRNNLTAHIAKLDEKARLALTQSRDDLAGAVITQQIGFEKQLAEWNAAFDKAKDEIEHFRTEVASLKMRKVELQDQLLRDLQAEQQAASEAQSDLERDQLDQRVTGALAAYDEAIAPTIFVDDGDTADNQAMLMGEEVQARMDMLRQESGGAEPTV